MRINFVDLIDDQIDRYQAILTIPRRINETTISDISYILEVVNKYDFMHKDQFIEFIMEEFNAAKNTAVNVQPTLGRANLLMRVGKNIKLTTMAKEYLKRKDVIYVSKGFIENYYGFLEAILLIEKKSPCKIMEIFNEWVRMYNSEFNKRSINTNYSQLRRIINYLTEFGLVYVECGCYKIKQTLLLRIIETEII